MSPYVVAGATGRVGCVVAESLLARGEPVRVIVRRAEQGASWAARGAEVAVGTLADRAFLVEALRGARGWFVLLPEDVSAVDFHGVRRPLVEAIAAAARGVPHVALLSAVAAGVPGGVGPARGLAALEEALASATTMTALRACSLLEGAIGAGLGPARGAGIWPTLAPADVAVPMVSTRDVGGFAVEALLHPPPRSERVDVLGAGTTARDLATTVGARLGRALHVVEIPPAGHVGALVEAGLSPSCAEAVAELMHALAAGRLRPVGDRAVVGSTAATEVVSAFLGAARG